MELKLDKTGIWAIISFAIMLVTHFLPAIGPITTLGMQVIGIFVGMIVGWSTCGMLVPSVLGILMLGVTEYAASPEAALDLLLTNNTFLTSLVAFIVLSYINESGIMDAISTWLVTRKFAAGKPWTFIVFFFAMLILISTVFAPVVLILMAFSFMSPILKEMGYTKDDMFPTYLFAGIGICAIATVIVPFLPSAIYTKGILSTALGMQISNFSYFMCISVPMLVAIVLYILVGKFILRVDTEKFAKGGAVMLEKIGDNSVTLTSAQKRGGVVLCAFVLLLALAALLPKTWAPVALLNKMGLVGVSIALTVVLLIVKDKDGNPLTTFPKLLEGISWDMVLLTGAIMVIASALTSQGTGIAAGMAMVGVMLSHMPMYVFVILVMLVLCVFSQFSMNMVLQMVFAPILAPIMVAMGGNPMMIIMAVYLGTQWAFLAPSGSMMAALVFGNTEWVKVSNLYKCVIPWIIVALIWSVFASLTFPGLFCPM